jgi:hypothetical protein
MIARRHVFFLAGYDPIDLRHQHSRFQREIAKFEKTWRLSAAVSEIVAAGDGGWCWNVAVRGPQWATTTTYEPLDWHDIVAADMARPLLPRLFGGLVAFLDFVLTGTAIRYFIASWRYGLFFLLPFFSLLLFTVVAIAAGFVFAHFAGALLFHTLLAVLVAMIVFLGLMRWPGRRWRIDQALADWIFARDFMYGRRRDVASRLEDFAQRVVAAAQNKGVDEILVVGHSLGATLAVDMLARALKRDPLLTAHGPAINLLTVGATIPKIALHPLAKKLRADMARVAAEPAIFWTEYQARRDPISFYKFDPLAGRQFRDNASGKKPHIQLVGMKDMLSPETFTRYKLHHMRLHYQFVMGNEQRARYDYFLICTGPAPFEMLSRAAAGALDLFDENGAFLPNAPASAISEPVTP